METGLFMTGSDWTTGPTSSPFVIYSSMATMTETVPNADPTLSVYETTDVKLVWNGGDLFLKNSWLLRTNYYLLYKIVLL